MEIQTGFCSGGLIDGGQVGRKDSKYICAFFRPSSKHFNIRLANKGKVATPSELLILGHLSETN